MKKSFGITVLAFAFIFTLNSCNSNKSGNVNQTTDTTAAAPAQPETGNILSLEANDEMQYSKTEMKATAGKPITLTFKHTGKMDKTTMGHDFVLLKQGVNADTFAHEAMSAKDNDYIPKSQISNIIAHTKLIGGGESDTITFIVPDKGTYDYLCSFPGHSALMKGKLIIE